MVSVAPQPNPLYSEIRAIALEAYAQQICDAAGVAFCGIQPGFDNAVGLVLFNEPKGSTLAVPLSTVSVDAIRARLSEHAASNPGGEPFLEYLRRTR